ncbi:hypothetical protein [Terribacillus saccharophilus]|uniref:hypothetical protein n=1 Tax=Terribacillus saccharophilus TaxID=361277 RepID=UPI003D28347A
MFLQRVNRASSLYKQDIEIYSDILTATLKYQLVESLEEHNTEIFKLMEQIASEGERVLILHIVPEHIYISTLAYKDDYALFSIEHCIYNYLYEDRFFGLLGRKQVKFKDINFKSFYEKMSHNVELLDLKLIDEIVSKEPLIIQSITSHFEKLGFITCVRPKEYTLEIKLSY